MTSRSWRARRQMISQEFSRLKSRTLIVYSSATKWITLVSRQRLTWQKTVTFTLNTTMSTSWKKAITSLRWVPEPAGLLMPSGSRLRMVMKHSMEMLTVATTRPVTQVKRAIQWSLASACRTTLIHNGGTPCKLFGATMLTWMTSNENLTRLTYLRTLRTLRTYLTHTFNKNFIQNCISVYFYTIHFQLSNLS